MFYSLPHQVQRLFYGLLRLLRGGIALLCRSEFVEQGQECPHRILLGLPSGAGRLRADA